MIYFSRSKEPNIMNKRRPTSSVLNTRNKEIVKNFYFKYKGLIINMVADYSRSTPKMRRQRNKVTMF